MTQVLIKGQENENKQLKKIVFVSEVSSNGEMKKTIYNSSDFDVVDLILTKEESDMHLDTMIAYCLVDSFKTIFYGHFNDGVV